MSNYDEMRGFADDAICRFRSNYSESGNAVVRLAEMVMHLTDNHELSIQDRLQALAVQMQDVAVAMLLSDSKKMQAKSEELRDAGNIVYEWLESMKAEETIQGFVEGRKI